MRRRSSPAQRRLRFLLTGSRPTGDAGSPEEARPRASQGWRSFSAPEGQRRDRGRLLAAPAGEQANEEGVGAADVAWFTFPKPKRTPTGVIRLPARPTSNPRSSLPCRKVYSSLDDDRQRRRPLRTEARTSDLSRCPVRRTEWTARRVTGYRLATGTLKTWSVSPPADCLDVEEDPAFDRHRDPIIRERLLEGQSDAEAEKQIVGEVVRWLVAPKTKRTQDWPRRS